MFLKLTVLLACLQLSLSIQGGDQTDITEVPYLVSIHKYRIHICYGSLLTKKFVLTAAHCTTNGKTGTFKVRLGSNSLESQGLLVDVLEVNQHQLYDPLNFDFDYSVLRLDDYTELNLPVGFVSLPNKELPLSDRVQISGWDTGNSNDIIITNFPKIKTVEECIRIHEDVYDVSNGMICAELPSTDFSICQSDSGSGLVSESIIYGVFSYSYKCDNPEFPGIYGRVFEVKSWIEEIIHN